MAKKVSSKRSPGSARSTPTPVVRQENYRAENIRGSAVAQGRDAKASLTMTTTTTTTINKIFERARKHIEERAENPDVEKKELEKYVKDIEVEAGKGEAANPKPIERWMTILKSAAKDVFDVVVGCLRDPGASVSAVVLDVVARVVG